MNNEPVAWMQVHYKDKMCVTKLSPVQTWEDDIPLYTHPVKELHLSLQKEKETGELLAVTYTDDEHRIVEVLWQRPPAKELTNEEMALMSLYEAIIRYENLAPFADSYAVESCEYQLHDAKEKAKAILRKAQEK